MLQKECHERMELLIQGVFKRSPYFKILNYFSKHNCAWLPFYLSIFSFEMWEASLSPRSSLTPSCSSTLPSHFPWSVTHAARSRLALHCTAYCQVLWTCNLVFLPCHLLSWKECVTSVSHALISGLKIATSANIMQMHNISLVGLWPYSLLIPFSLLARMFRNSSSSFRCGVFQ